MHIRSLDVNLLRCFDALMKERNVSRAAERLGLSQPAVSHALSRLRSALKDPLFVRSQREMIPTSRALDLRDPVHRLIDDLNRILAVPLAFEPGTAATRFVLTSTEYNEYVLAPGLMALLQREAPGVTVEFRMPVRERMVEWMEQGEVDFRVSTSPLWEAPKSMHSRPLYHDRLVCLARRGHPTLRGRMTSDQFFALSHVRPRLGYTNTARLIDKLASAQGRRLRIALRAQNLLTVAHAVAASELIAAVPERYARMVVRQLPLQAIEPPIELPGVRVALYWHERSHRQPSHTWFRRVLAAVARGVAN